MKRELGYIRVVSDVQRKLKAYLEGGSGKDADARVAEPHKSSRLGIHMRASG